MVESVVRKIVPWCTYALTRNGGVIIQWKSHLQGRRRVQRIFIPLGLYHLVSAPDCSVREICANGTIYQV